MNTQSFGKRSKSGVAALCAAALGMAAAVLLLAGCGEKATTPENYKLTVKFEPAGSGFADLDPADYKNGDQVTVTAVPKSGKYVFTEWAGDASGAGNPTIVNMNGDKTLTAVFEERYSITTSVSPAGSGTITRSSDSAYYPANTTIVLTADPTSKAYKFVGWEGDTTTDVDQFAIKINRDVTYTAIFHQSYQILVTITGNGTVSRDNEGPYYEEGEEVTLTANGEGFAGWYDGDTRLSAQHTYTVQIGDKDVKLTAKFVEL